VEFSTRLREARKSAGLTQEALARRLDVTVTTVSRWETGAFKPKSLDELYRIADTLGVRPSDLLAGNGDVARREREEQKA